MARASTATALKIKRPTRVLDAHPARNFAPPQMTQILQRVISKDMIVRMQAVTGSPLAPFARLHHRKGSQ